MQQHHTPTGQPLPGDRWTRDRFALDTVTARRRPRLARLLDQPVEPHGTNPGGMPYWCETCDTDTHLGPDDDACPVCGADLDEWGAA